MQPTATRILSLALVLTLAATAASQGETAATIAGTWSGQIATPPPLDVVVRFDGAASGTIDIPVQGAMGLPLEAIEVEGTAVRFAIAGVPGTPTFVGTFDAHRMTGTFSQGGMDFPFDLERAAADAAPQDDATAVYEDPNGVFTVPVPTGWTVEERDGHLAMISPEGGIRLSFLTFPDEDLDAVVERAWATVDPDFDAPVDATLEPPSEPGIERTLVVNYESASDLVYQAIAQLHEGVAHVLLVDADLEPAQRRGTQINLIFSGYTILALEETDLTGVAPRPVGEIVDELEAFIEATRQAFGIPGAAVAIVQDDAVAYASGFGVRGADGAAMTADTHMMIGSTGKTLTTMLMAAMVDDGRFAWDTPVVEVLPEFAVADPDLSASMVMWHLVCACSGVPRRDLELLFNADDLSAEDVVASLATFEFFTDFGEVFQYSNQLVGTGGYAAAAADGAAWGELAQGYAASLDRRVLDPIGMTHTTLSFDEVVARGEHGVPHQLDLDTGAYVEVPLDVERSLVPIAPAGAHWSTAEDMARYLITQLNVGVAPDGTRVVSEENLRRTWTPTVPITATANYGLGWIVGENRGLPVLQHGGNTLGFTSEFAFLPEAGIGVVILTNGQGTNLFNGAVLERLFELLFDQPARADANVAFGVEQTEQALADLREPLRSDVDEAAVAPYLGTFASPELGSITLTLEDGMLTMDVGEFRTEMRPSVDDEGEVEHYVMMQGPVAGTPFEFTEEEGEPVITLGEGAVFYTFERVE